MNKPNAQGKTEGSAGLAPALGSASCSPLDLIEGRQSYTPLRLAIEMDSLAAWVKRHKPDWPPEKIAEALREEIERIEQEMMDGNF